MVTIDPSTWDIPAPTQHLDSGFPRILAAAHDGVILAVLVATFACAGYRTYFRIAYFGKLYIDDYSLFVGIVFLIIADVLCVWF